MKKIRSLLHGHAWRQVLPYIIKGCFDIHDQNDINISEEWLIKIILKNQISINHKYYFSNLSFILFYIYDFHIY